MKRFIEGLDRSQTTLLPDCIDDYVAEDNSVRAIDAFVEESSIDMTIRSELVLASTSVQPQDKDCPRPPVSFELCNRSKVNQRRT